MKSIALAQTSALASRNGKEIIRDKINLAFGIGFPVILLLLLTAIQSNIPVNLFEIGNLTPGIAVFGLSFISLFSGMLIARDRTSSFMLRLFASPLTSGEFILAYTAPLLPMALTQIAMCYVVAFFLGLTPSINILIAIISQLPTAVLFIAIGLLCGSLFSDRQVGGICGALLTNLCGWLSGTWFELDLVGGAFKTVAYIFPFVHAVNVGKAAVSGDWAAMFPDIWWVTGYAAVVLAVAVFAFKMKMDGDKN